MNGLTTMPIELADTPNIDCFWLHGFGSTSFRTSLYDFHSGLIIGTLEIGYQNGHHLRSAVLTDHCVFSGRAGMLSCCITTAQHIYIDRLPIYTNTNNCKSDD